MKKNNYTYHKDGANISVIKIEATHCFCCGNNLDATTAETVKTKHHAIPEEMRPVRNIIIPVCRKCHTKIHQGQSFQEVGNNNLKKKLESITNQFETMRVNIEAIKKEIGK